MTRNLRRNRTDRCLTCGLRTTLHFTADNVKLSCADASIAHPRAKARLKSASELMAEIVRLGPKVETCHRCGGDGFEPNYVDACTVCKGRGKLAVDR